MQSAQDQPPALTVVRPLGATNGKEEEADPGEEAELTAVSLEFNLCDTGEGPETLRSKVAVLTPAFGGVAEFTRFLDTADVTLLFLQISWKRRRSLTGRSTWRRPGPPPSLTPPSDT